MALNTGITTVIFAESALALRPLSPGWTLGLKMREWSRLARLFKIDKVRPVFIQIPSRMVLDDNGSP
jgi:hypothetical protein